MNGTLALAGSGEFLPTMERVDRWLLDRVPDTPRVALLPTASGHYGQRRIRYWLDLGTEYFTRLGVEAEPLNVFDRRDAQDARLAERVSAANFVYLSGGRPTYLQRSLVGTPVLRAIYGVLESGGIVAGSSAGAMVWGEKFLGFPKRAWPWHDGFNHLSGRYILPHYDEIPAWLVWLTRASRLNRLDTLGIEKDTALVCHGGRFEVRGSGHVVVRTRTGTASYAEGETITWD